MKVQITLRQLRNSIINPQTAEGIPVGLSALNKLGNASLSPKMMFHIGRMAEDARKELERIEKQRVALIEQYKTPKLDKDGAVIPEQFEVVGENLKAFNKEWDELLDSTVDIEAKIFTVDDFEKYEAKLEQVEFAGHDFAVLGWMIQMKDEDDKANNVESIADHQAAKAQAA